MESPKFEELKFCVFSTKEQLSFDLKTGFIEKRLIRQETNRLPSSRFHAVSNRDLQNPGLYFFGRTQIFGEG